MPNTEINKIFDAEPKSLAEFLGANDQGCFIPSYQRAYAWRDEEVSRLFEDAITGLARLPKSPSSLRFLGTIITVTDKSLLGVAEPMDQQLPETVMTIIDGQQRLCTLIVVNILLHDAIRRMEAALDAGDKADGFDQIVGDYLYDLMKTFQFVGRPTETIWRFYPRVIRARIDQWARHQNNAKYESPIARLVWAYIQHSAQPAEPFDYAVPDDAEKGSGHQALAGVTKHVREALACIAEGEFEGRQIIDPAQLVGEAVQNAEFWIAKFPTALTQRLAAGISEPVQQLLRLMAFGRYLNTRMAITVVTTAQEDYAFDIFEALNTTGQPLTAFETFRPKVIEAEGMLEFPHSLSAADLKRINAFLDRSPKADDRQRATSTLLIPFRLLDRGERLEARLASQRTYLRSTYDDLPDIGAKRAFTSALATMADFLQFGWQSDAGAPAAASPGGKPLTDPEAAFCFEAMRALRHDITIGPMARFYDAADGVAGSPATLQYEGAIKAMTAFSMMWRAAKGGTANIDSRYRTLMSGGQDVPNPLARRKSTGEANPMPTLTQVQSELWAMLKRAKLHTRALWVAAAAQRPVYADGVLVARFLLLVAMHNSVAEGTTGLVTGDGRGNIDLLTPQEWYAAETESIEHVAPDSKEHANWPAAIYEDNRVVHQLGNLLPLPKLENNEAADHSWQRKRVLLDVFSNESKAKAKASIEEAKKVGITLGKKAEAIALENKVLPLARSAATYDGEWDVAFVALRSKRLAELAWDRMASWLGPMPGAAAAGTTVAAPASAPAPPATD